MLKFLTGNKNKFFEVQHLLGDLVEQIDIDLPEIQEVDAKKVIEAKLKEAFKHHPGPFIVEDVFLYMECINGLPGPLIKWFLETIGNEGLANLAQKLGNDKGSVACVIGYAADAKAIEFFEHRIYGQIVQPRGKGGFGWNPIFQAADSDQTYAEFQEMTPGASPLRKEAYGKLKRFLESK